MHKINRIIVGFIVWLWLPVAYAATLTATIDSNTIVFGESVHLIVRLDDAVANEPLDLSVLAKDFIIYNQQQYSAYRNINGKTTTDIGWNVTLMPKKNGDLVIPAISIATNAGRLSSQPINIAVQAAATGTKRPDDALGISLIASVNKNKAYVNEPVIYTIKVISYKPLANIVLDDIKSNDAMIEKIGEAKQSEQILGGVRAHMIELKYAVTGIKPGKTVINPVFMHGELQIQAPQTSRPQRFGLFNNLFLDSMIELKPFSLQSEEIVLEVLPPAIKDHTWLPARNLTLTEKWDNVDAVHVGDTVLRKTKLAANGNFANQLPSLKDYMQTANVKIYTSKPVLNDKSDSEIIIGTKEEEHSIIPQQPGTIILPAIKIKWWNVVTSKVEIATLPAKTIEVLPAVNKATDNTVDFSGGTQQTEPSIDATAIATSKQKILSPWWLALIGLVGGILLTIAGVWIYFVVKKRVAKRATLNKIINSLEPTKITTAVDLRAYIIEHANKFWRLPSDVSLNRLGELLTLHNYGYDLHLYTSLLSHLNAALYAQATVGVNVLVAQWEEFKKSVVKHKTHKNKQTVNSAGYSSLNPT